MIHQVRQHHVALVAAVLATLANPVRVASLARKVVVGLFAPFFETADHAFSELLRVELITTHHCNRASLHQIIRVPRQAQVLDQCVVVQIVLRVLLLLTNYSKRA